MSFMLFEKAKGGYKNLHNNICLAGCRNGLIFKAWHNKGRPSKGWEVSAEELLKSYNSGYGTQTHVLIIKHITKEWCNFLEISKIYIYTYKNGKDHIWSPIMFELHNLTEAKEKSNLLVFDKKIKVFDFKYLRSNQWLFPFGGLSGTLIYEDAGNYFKKFFWV